MASHVSCTDPWPATRPLTEVTAIPWVLAYALIDIIEVLHGHGAIQPRISKLESVNVRQPVLTDAWRIDQKSCHVENFTNDFGW